MSPPRRERVRARFPWTCARALLTGCALALACPAPVLALPDLEPEIFDVGEFVQDVPAAEVAEGCAGGTDDRRLVRFALYTHNRGPDDWVLGDHGCPSCAGNPGAACTNPLFVCGTGHAWPLIASFALPELLDDQGQVVAQGYKPGFCLLDSVCASPQYFQCGVQGISAGCADLYGSGFKCMYVDFTDAGLAPGTYTLRVTSDPFDALAESDETNNVAEVPVTIGPPPPDCGDGDLDPGEQCDDDGTADGDGCDASCQLEVCHTCVGEPSSCTRNPACDKCRRVIGKETLRLVQARAKLVTKCEVQKVKGKHTEACPDPAGTGFGKRTADKLAKATSKYAARIAKRCGGDDRTCNGGLANEVTPASLLFPAACPSFEGSAEPACADPVAHCGEVADCLECIQRTAVDQAVALAFGDLIASDPSAERDRNKCQRTIGGESERLLARIAAERAKCWDLRRKGRHEDGCPDPAAPVGSAARKAAEKIAKARGRHDERVCRACGGPDRACGGGDDLDPQTAIGFADTCPAVTVPGGASCGGLVTTLEQLVDCAACVVEFKATCVDAAAVPEYVPYPAECNP